jgi:hypothetical protein
MFSAHEPSLNTPLNHVPSNDIICITEMPMLLHKGACKISAAAPYLPQGQITEFKAKSCSLTMPAACSFGLFPQGGSLTGFWESVCITNFQIVVCDTISGHGAIAAG